jgi:DNA-binding NtrC family response regulator
MSAHILLIEDDDDVRAEIAEYLLRRRYRVTACATVEEASDALENVRGALAPDTIVSDIRLPDGDGVSFYVANARRFPRTKWILMSGNPDLVRLGNRLTNLTDLPGCAVIDKPVPFRLLDRFIQTAQAA